MDDQIICSCGVAIEDVLFEAETVREGMGCYACQYGGRIPPLPMLFEMRTVTVKLPQGCYIVQGRFEVVGTFDTWASCLIHMGVVIHRSIDPNDKTRMYLILKAIMLGLSDPKDPLAILIEHNFLEENYVRINRP